MEYNLVTNFKIVQELKKYKNFKVSLGFSNTVDQNDRKVYNEKDKFAYFYNQRYRTTIFGQGLIGDISVYTDHYIKEDQLAIYFDREEFVFNFDWAMYKEKGIEWYLGYLLKDIEFKLEASKKKPEEIKEEKKGNPYKLVPGHPQYNPGSVTFDDVKAYKEAKLNGTIK